MKLAYPNISFDKNSKVFVTFYINNKRYRLYNGDRIIEIKAKHIPC